MHVLKSLTPNLVVSSVERSLAFYRDTLGFREVARAGQNGNNGELTLQVSEGSDYIELIQFSGAPSANLKSQNHFGLASVDVHKTVANLQSRTAGASRTPSLTIQTVDGPAPAANLFDPDGARIEFMAPLPSTVPPAPHPTSTQ